MHEVSAVFAAVTIGCLSWWRAPTFQLTMKKYPSSVQRQIDAEQARRLSLIANCRVRWQSELDAQRGYRLRPIPWSMILRGYLPVWLGGRPAYEAVVSSQHFSSDIDLMEWLSIQCESARFLSDRGYEVAIRLLIYKVRSRMRKTPENR